jgi:hypothetical protein
MKKLILLAVATMLFASNANAVLWTIDATPQDGTNYTPGFGTETGSATLGFTAWFTVGTNGGGNQNIVGSTGAAPGTATDYACYGLVPNVPNVADTSCAIAGATVLWDTTPVVFSGSFNDDMSFMDLSWTGQSGSEVPFGFFSLFTSSVMSGSYDASGNISGGVDLGAGYDSGGFSCWNNPLNGITGGPDFCGNGTGTAGSAPVTGPQTKFNRELPLGLTGLLPHGDGTWTITMEDQTYSDCVNDVGGACTPGSNSSDVFAQWRVNATLGTVIPIPAAVWLFGSALGLLGWLRRRASV